MEWLCVVMEPTIVEWVCSNSIYVITCLVFIEFTLCVLLRHWRQPMLVFPSQRPRPVLPHLSPPRRPTSPVCPTSLGTQVHTTLSTSLYIKFYILYVLIFVVCMLHVNDLCFTGRAGLLWLHHSVRSSTWLSTPLPSSYLLPFCTQWVECNVMNSWVPIVTCM